MVGVFGFPHSEGDLELVPLSGVFFHSDSGVGLSAQLMAFFSVVVIIAMEPTVLGSVLEFILDEFKGDREGLGNPPYDSKGWPRDHSMRGLLWSSCFGRDVLVSELKHLWNGH
ncbi:hypothetical protein GW17_00002917 [Ensete ventricosum]|nr:hypothetical protein GW17_00002917 [Ensete ventricosum]